MVDDYTAKMTELIELMRMIGNDTQQCEVKELQAQDLLDHHQTRCPRSPTAPAAGSSWACLKRTGSRRSRDSTRCAMQEALSQACEKMTPVVRPVIVTCPFEGANLVFARIDEMLPRDKPCFTTALWTARRLVHRHRRRRPAHDLL